MDHLILGQLMVKKPSAASSFPGPWLARKGDQATYAIELIVGGSNDFKYRIQTKNSEDPDSSAVQIGSDKTIGSTPGIIETIIPGAKEYVRYVVITVNNANGGRMHFRWLDPQWARN